MSATSQAIAKRNDGPEQVIQNYADDFGMVLPSHVNPDHFIRLAQSALRRNPDLKSAASKDVGSFLAALLDCARYGLEPGDTYHLVPFGNKVVGIKDYSGEIELMYRTGRISAVKCEVVYERDHFRWNPTTMDRPEHEADWFGDDRGAMVGVYAYAELIGGATTRVVVLNRKDIADIRAVSKTADRADGMWVKWPDRAWRKSAVHQLWNWVPKSAEYLTSDAAAKSAAENVARARAIPAPEMDWPDDSDVIEGEVVDDADG